MSTRRTAAGTAARPDDAACLTGRQRRDAIFEAVIGQRADDAARSRDVALTLLGQYVHAAVEIATSRAAEHGTQDVGARIEQILAATRTDIDLTLARIEAALRSGQ